MTLVVGHPWECPRRPPHPAILRAVSTHIRRKRTLFSALGGCAALLLLWTGVGIFLFVVPQTDAPRKADALFVLAPSAERISYAQELMEQGYAQTLAVSVPLAEDGGEPGLSPCATQRPYKIVCFSPSPVTTQGEARALQRLARDYGWKSVNVVTSQSHITRARIIMGRCFDGDIHMVASWRNMPILASTNLGNSWAYVYVYETAALTKAATLQTC